MKKFRDLEIFLNGVDRDEAFQAITDACGEHWKRSYDKEADTARFTPGTVYAFEHVEGDSLEHAGLVIMEKESNTWYVPNIVPLGKGRFSYGEYNNLAKDFAENILKTASLSVPFKYELSKETISDVEILGERPAKLLKTFSATANKSTGSSHPSDQKRWFAFLYSVEGMEVYAEDVEKILLEQGWSEKYALKLAIQFEFSQALLAYGK